LRECSLLPRQNCLKNVFNPLFPSAPLAPSFHLLRYPLLSCSAPSCTAYGILTPIQVAQYRFGPSGFGGEHCVVFCEVARSVPGKGKGLVLAFELTTRIDRPVNEVFAFVADFENIPMWNYFVHDVTKTSDGPINVGTTYHQVRRTDKQDFRVTDFQPNRVVAVKTLPDASPQFSRRFTFQVDGDTTHIIDEWELETGKPALIERLAAGQVKSAVAENLSKLKSLLETGSVILQDGRIESF
jgi:uncharacterized membrane protein